MEGYIKLYRKLIKSPIFQNEKLLKIWIWCLCRANHRETETIVGLRKVQLQKGQFVFGLIKASQELQIPKTTLYRNLRTLCEFGMISIKAENKFSVVTVENWEKYQCLDSETEKETEKKRKRNGKQTETDKNDKNVKNDKEDIYTSDFQEIADAYNRICHSLPKCTTLSDKRKKALHARLKSGFRPSDFEEVFRKAEESDFLSGRKGKWKAGFDWLINENNMIKVREGNYDNRKEQGNDTGYLAAESTQRADTSGDYDYSKFFAD
ncbi:hypothetical protein AALA24_02330 [Anaerovoracaceae bacterium 42-11]